MSEHDRPDEPIIPDADRNCQGCGRAGVPLYPVRCEPADEAARWREATACDSCLERLDADMWISQKCWTAINPVVPFESLPAWIADATEPDR